MTTTIDHLKKWIEDMAVLMEEDVEPDLQYYTLFLKEPDVVLTLIQLINSLEEDDNDDESPFYSAAIFALDICIAQLQAARENGSKAAIRIINELMDLITQAIRSQKHSLNFWLPILNCFYAVHLELSPGLKEAYLDLASHDEDFIPDNFDHLEAIREMIRELSDHSDFDIAENFFAQSYAMPPDFFADLMFDLYSIEEAQDIALLILLHPKDEVREVAVATFNYLVDKIIISPVSLSRLQAIRNWYPSSYHSQFDNWIKIQRKKGVLFHVEKPANIVCVKASEIDGTGAQGIFVHLREGRKNRLCGLLFKRDYGIKDAWLTQEIKLADVKRCYAEAFNDSISLRDVDLPYLIRFANHFIAEGHAHLIMPDLHLLEIQELLGLHFKPELIDVHALIEELAVQISPFTPETMKASLKRSGTWLKSKHFTESWYTENASIDKLVNRSCSFVDGKRVCRVPEAVASVIEEEFEVNRHQWLFHFLWIALWGKVKSRKNEKLWEDSFFIAYAIHTGRLLIDIPLMIDIARHTVINSVETMNDRRTHLNKE